MQSKNNTFMIYYYKPIKCKSTWQELTSAFHHIEAAQDVAEELFALLTEAKTVYLQEVKIYGKYRAQNEAYKEVDGEKRRKALPVKELCVMAASGRAKRNVYIGLHSV